MAPTRPLDLPNPVIRSHYGNGFIKQYVRDHLLLRTEAATNNVRDYAVPKAIDNLPQLRPRLSSIVDNYLDAQQDILETFVDRGQLRQQGQPTVLPKGKRIPGLKLDHPRQLAVMHALVCFSHIAAHNTFTTKELHTRTTDAFGVPPEGYTSRPCVMISPNSAPRPRGEAAALPALSPLPEGYRICLVFLKLFERIYAPVTPGLLQAFPPTRNCRTSGSLSRLDTLYQQVVQALDRLLSGRRPQGGLNKVHNENRISRYGPYNGLSAPCNAVSQQLQTNTDSEYR
jgi:hypothetical protein